jgi:hypothetical protein
VIHSSPFSFSTVSVNGSKNWQGFHRLSALEKTMPVGMMNFVRHFLFSNVKNRRRRVKPISAEVMKPLGEGNRPDDFVPIHPLGWARTRMEAFDVHFWPSLTHDCTLEKLGAFPGWKKNKSLYDISPRARSSPIGT